MSKSDARKGFIEWISKLDHRRSSELTEDWSAWWQGSQIEPRTHTEDTDPDQEAVFNQVARSDPSFRDSVTDWSCEIRAILGGIFIAE